MTATESRRFLAILICTLPVLYGQENDIPELSIYPLKPYGLRVSMPNIQLMNYFEFQGNVNKKLEFGDTGDIRIVVLKPKNGYWTSEDENVKLEVGDIIHYYFHISVRRQKGYDRKDLSYTVTKLYDSEEVTQKASTTDISNRANIESTTASAKTCGKTLTQIKPTMGLSTTACAGQIIFEDNFDTLRNDLWTVEHYIPAEPDYPFVSYQRLPVSVENGILRIEPRMLEDFPDFNNETILTGELDLSKTGCTRRTSCTYKSNGPQILHPIISGRITSNAFAFKYGIVEVRAKVPQGDWLYPDILLEAVSKPYCGEGERALRIAGARGNLWLTKGVDEYGNKVLYGGPTMDVNCRSYFQAKKIADTAWGNDFHVYSIIWDPDMITLIVDGEEWGRIKLTSNDLQSLLPTYTRTCDSLRTSLANCLTPFDEFLGITLGLSAGGIAEFPDGVVSGHMTTKPWKNTESKARLKFYQARDSWLPSWSQRALLIDYIRVRALQ